MGESRQIIIDAGAIVAVIDGKDQWHKQAAVNFRELPKPFFTCESALSEAHYILRRSYVGRSSISELFISGVIQIGFDLSVEIETVMEYMKTYKDVPMSLADACLVRMTELFPTSLLFTFDSDFSIYRRNKNDRINTIPNN